MVVYNLIQRPGQPDTRGITIQTRRGRDIKNTLGAPLNSIRKERAQKDLRDNIFSSGTVLPQLRKSPTGMYNCHGLTFLNRRANLNDPLEIVKILTDDEYKAIELPEVMAGDIVIYYDKDGDITHTGIVVEVKPDVAMRSRIPFVLSQWGEAGEYIHPYNFSPYTTLSSPGWYVKYMREGQND